MIHETIITQYSCEEDWLNARLGIPTASRFSDACSRLKSGEMSQAGKDYALELLAERLTGEKADKFTSFEMQWGKDQEEFAILELEQKLGVRINQTQYYFATKEIAPGCVVGATPDAVSDDYLFEIKCPKTVNHLKNRLEFISGIPDKYVHQVGGQSMIFDKKVILVSYDPRLLDADLRLSWVESTYQFQDMMKLIEFCNYVNRLEGEI